MRRRSLTALVAAVAAVSLLLGTAWWAFAGGPSPRAGTLTGSLEDSSGHARLRIHYRIAHHEKIRWCRWRFTDVPLKCKRGRRTYRFPVTGGEGIWNKYADGNPFGGNTSEAGKR